MNKAWAILNEPTDLGRHIGSVVELSSQSKTAAQAFKKTKDDIVTSHLSAFARQEIKFWRGHHVAKEVVDNSRKVCLEEASRVNGFLGTAPERKVDFALGGEQIQLEVTSFQQEVEQALHFGKKNIGHGKGLVPLWLEAELARADPADVGSTIDAELLEEYNKSRSIINELAESLAPTVDGLSVIRFILSRSSRWLPHDSSGMGDVALLRKFAGATGAQSMWRALETKLPHPGFANDGEAIIESLRGFHASRLASFCGKAPRSEVKTTIDAVQKWLAKERIQPETVNIADAQKKKTVLERITHLYHIEVKNEANGMMTTFTGAKALKHLLFQLHDKVERGAPITINDTAPLKVFNYALDEDDQKLRLKITRSAMATLREQSAAGVVDAGTMQVVETVGVVEAPRMHPKELLGVVPTGSISEASASSAGAERRAKVARVASIFLQKPGA